MSILSTSTNPFDLYWDDKYPCKPYSPTGSEDSTLTDSSLAEAASSRSSSSSMDPWTAEDTIQRFLAQKVRTSRAVSEYRKRCIEKRAELSPEKSVFHVETVSPEHYPDILKVIAKWNAKIDSLCDESLTEEDEMQMNAIIYIVDSLVESIESKSNPDEAKERKPESLLVAKDASGTIQAMAFISRQNKELAIMDSSYHIDYLVSSPHNLRLSFQKDGIRGAATAIIEEVVYKSMRHSARRKVSLIPTLYAEPFYRKLGFARKWDSSLFLSKARMLKFLSVSGGTALA